jgi:hypothetical protein
MTLLKLNPVTRTGTSVGKLVTVTSGPLNPLPLVINVELDPAPCKISDLEIVTPEAQVELPAGTTTVSPAAAELTADCTSVGLPLEAVIVAAWLAGASAAAKQMLARCSELFILSETKLLIIGDSVMGCLSSGGRC